MTEHEARAELREMAKRIHGADEWSVEDVEMELLSLLPLLAATREQAEAVRWKKAVLEQEFYDGDLIICAVELSGGAFEYGVVSVRCDEGRFELWDRYDDDWGWEWTDVSWWLPVPKIPEDKAAIDAAGGAE